MRSELGF
jgi:hypothetical protein